MTKKSGGKEKHPRPSTRKRNQRSLDTKTTVMRELPAGHERRASALENLLQVGQAITAPIELEQVLFRNCRFHLKSDPGFHLRTDPPRGNGQA
jgi:hypothetical protein